MAISQNTKNYLSKVRQEGPSYYKYLPDDVLYWELDKKGTVIPPEAKWEQQSYKSPEQAAHSQKTEDLGFFANLADWWIDDNSYDWMKAAYNHSLTGTAEKLLNGESRYDVDESDFNILQDIGATVVSFLMPLDILTMAAGGAIGGAVANTALKKGLMLGATQKAAAAVAMRASQRQIGKTVAKKAGEKGLKGKAIGDAVKNAQKAYMPLGDSRVLDVLTTGQRALFGAAQQAPVLSLYEAAITGLNYEIEGKNFLEGAAWGAFHGGMLGAATGAIGGGMGAIQSSMFKKAGGKEYADLGLKDYLISRGVVGLPGQALVESSVFSGVELAERVAAGEDIQGKEILHTFARNAGLFGVLKTQGILTKKTIEKWNETKAQLEGSETPIKDIIDNVKETLIDSDVKVPKEVNVEGYKATQKELENVKKINRIEQEFNNNKDKLFDKDGNIRTDITDMETIVKLVETTNNYLITEIEKFKQLEKSTVNNEIKQKAEEARKEMEAIKEKIDETFGNKEWMKTKDAELTIGGLTKEQAKKQLDDIAIKEYADEYNVKNIKRDKDTNEIINKDEVIDAIYKQHEVLDVQQKELARIGGEEAAAKALKGAGVVEKPSSEKIKAEVSEKEFFTNPDKLDKDTKKHVKPIKESNLSDEAKNALAYSSINTGRDISPSGTKEASKLMEFCKEKNGRDITQLTPSEFEFLVSKYINDRLGFEIINKKSNVRISKEKLSEHFKGNQEKTLESILIYNRVLNNLKEHFHHGEMKNILGYDIMAPKGKSISVFQPEGRKEIQIPGGKEGLDKLSQSAKNKKKGFDVGEKNISGEESSLMIDLLSEGKARPGDAHHIRVKDINLEDGTITLRKKTKRPNINISDKTLDKIKNHIKKNNLKENDKLFKVENTTELNILMDKIYENAPKNIQPLIHDTATGKKYPFIDRKATLPEVKIGKETGGGGKVRENIQGSSLFRRRTDGEEGLEIWGHRRKSTGKHYQKSGRPPPIKQEKKEKRKKQVATEKVKENLEIGIERQESMKELILKGSRGRRKAYKNLEIKLNRKLKKDGGKEVLGQIEGHTISIAEGKVKIDTIPHEVSHYVVDVLKAFGSKLDKALIKRGRQMFGSEEALVQRIGEYAANQLTNKSLVGKAKSWVKAFNARLKAVLGLANKEDVAYLMSRRVVKGNIPTNRKIANYINRMETHYQKKTPTKDINVARADKLDKRYESKLGRDYLDRKKEEFGIKGNKKDWNDGDIQNWVEWLEKTNELQKKSKENKTTYLDEVVNEYNITPDEAIAITESFSGGLVRDYNKLTKSNKNKFQDHVRTEGFVSEKIETVIGQASSLIDAKLPHSIKRMILPSYYVLQKYGGAPGRAIAQKILQFDFVANSIYKGRGDLAISLIRTQLNSKQERLVWMFDAERVNKMLIDGANAKKKAVRGLTAEEARFFSQLKDKNGKEITHKTKKSDITTKPGMAKKIHADLMHNYWLGLKKEVKGVTNRSEYALFQKEFNKKFIDGYFSRRVTKDALEYFVSAKNAKNLEGKINESIKESAKNKAKNEGLEGAKYLKRVDELINDTNHQNSVAKDVLNMITHKHHKVKNKHLLKRGPLIDEFITITDMKTGKEKTIRTYETDLSTTVEPYVMTMSKYIATVKLFPEYTGLGGKYKLSKGSIDQINTMIADKTLGAYALKTVQKLVGFKGEDPMLSEVHSGLAKFSHMSAAAGLSSPTSGLKNLMIGIPRSIGQYGFINTGIGMIKLFDKSVWSEAREKGILEYGAKHLELGQARLGEGKLGWFSMERLFRYNFMTSSENMNRIVSHEAGKLFFQNQLNILQGKKGLFGESSKKNATRALKDIWKFSDDDIAFLNSKEVRDMAFKSTKSEGKYEYLLRQAGHYSHVSAQGGTSVGLVPLWMSGNMGKPFTLFQRMAYATTFDSYINFYKPAFTHGNFAPLVRALAMHTLSGAALYGFYKMLFDKEPPESAGTNLDKMTMYLYRSEFLGLAGFLMSPYDEGMFQSLAQPVIARNAREGLRQFNAWYSGGQDLGKSINNVILKTTVAYNQYDQLVWKNTPEYKLMKKVRNWKGQFADDYPTFKTPKVDAYSERTFYYRDLKDALYFGSDKEIINNYFAAYNFIVTELEEINSSPQWRHKSAIKALKSSLSSMNPLKISDESTGKNMSKKRMFLNWIKDSFGQEGYKEALKSEKQYKYKMRHLERLLKRKGVWKEKSVYSSLNL